MPKKGRNNNYSNNDKKTKPIIQSHMKTLPPLPQKGTSNLNVVELNFVARHVITVECCVMFHTPAPLHRSDKKGVKNIDDPVLLFCARVQLVIS